MTGTTARTHGDRSFDEHLLMDPNLPTLPQVFGDSGYQTNAVGKLHVYPQRDRIGFDEVISCEEGRHHLGGDGRDDFERFLAREGYAGQELTHGMGNNQYEVRPWHLPERCHPTNWTVREMCRTIQRRDPTRPAFWYCSFIAPHPPIAPPRDYLDLYDRIGVDEPIVADWAADFDELPFPLAFCLYCEERMRRLQYIPVRSIPAIFVIALATTPAHAADSTAVDTSLYAEHPQKIAHAVRVAVAPMVDGRLDDEAWLLAPVQTGFTQGDPDPGNRHPRGRRRTAKKSADRTTAPSSEP